MRKLLLYSPFLLVAIILLIVFYIVMRNDTSPVAKFTQWYSNLTEGFLAPVGDVPKCPTNYRFFNDKRGDSFCCNGRVNPFTHTCESKNYWDLCAFESDVTDPRNPQGKLVSCSLLTTKTYKESSDAHCPGNLPHFGTIGKCCLNDTDLDGYDCTARDNADTKKYCVINNPKPGEQSCSALRMDEVTTCPSGLAKMPYTMGQKEQSKYGSSANMTIPVCFGMEQSCIPNNVITEVQKRGIFSDKTNLDGWKYSCSGYERVNVQRDLTAQMDATYV